MQHQTLDPTIKMSMYKTFSMITRSIILIALCSISLAEAKINIYIGNILADIQIQGNHRTKDLVIYRELLIQKDRILTKADIDESRQRLKNLRIFSTVTFEFAPLPDERVLLIIHVAERWTTIPIIKAGSGGGTRFFTIGGYDINSFGRYWELGGQYEQLNGKNSGVTWFRNPRLFNQRLLFGYDLWFVTHSYELFDQAGKLASAFSVNKNRIHLFIKKELTNWFELGVGLDYVDQQVGNFGLNDAQKQANTASAFVFSANTRQNYLEFDTRLGRLNYDSFLVSGKQLDLKLQYASTSLGSTLSSFRALVQSKIFTTIGQNQTLGVNFVIGHTNSSVLQDQFYVGGLLEVRGFNDGEFSGSNYWQTNLEYRAATFRSKWLVLQNIAFIDIGNVADSFSDVVVNKDRPFYSIGTGIRLLSPKVYRLNIRIDIAKTFGRRDTMGVSLGLQQFF